MWCVVCEVKKKRIISIRFNKLSSIMTECCREITFEVSRLVITDEALKVAFFYGLCQIDSKIIMSTAKKAVKVIKPTINWIELLGCSKVPLPDASCDVTSFLEPFGKKFFTRINTHYRICWIVRWICLKSKAVLIATRQQTGSTWTAKRMRHITLFKDNSGSGYVIKVWCLNVL